jgi:hypothetical protein
MNFYFVEVLNRKDEWVRWDYGRFDSFVKAKDYALEHGLRDDTHFFRINCEWDDRFAYYGPCH